MLNDTRLRWLILFVPVAVLGVFFWYGVADSLWKSFASPEIGLQNYAAFLQSPAEMAVLRRTFLVSMGVTAVCLAFGYPYAYLMTVTTARLRTLLMVVVLIPFWTSMMVRTYAWVALLQNNGPLDRVFKSLGIGGLALIGTPGAIMIGITQILMPFMIMSLYANMVRIDRRLLDAADSLGASPAVAFVKVFVPMTVPGVVAGCTLVFVLSLGFYLAPVLLGSPQHAMLSQLIVQQVSQLLDFGRAGAMAGVLLALALCVVALGAVLARPAIERGYGENT